MQEISDRIPLKLPNIVLFGDNEAASSPELDHFPPSPIVEVAESFISAIINAGACVADYVEGFAEELLSPEADDETRQDTFRPI